MSVCVQCKMICLTRRELMKHISSVHAEFRCEDENCSRVFSNRHACLKHFKREHGSSDASVKPPNSKFSSSETVSKTLLSCQTEMINSNNDNESDPFCSVSVLPNNCSETSDCISDEPNLKERIRKETLDFVVKLYAKSTVPRNQVQKVIEYVSDFADALIKSLAKEVEKTLIANNVPSTCVNNVASVFSSHGNLFSEFSSEHKRLKLFEKENLFIKPVPLPLGESKQIVSSSKRAQSKSVNAQYVPLTTIFERFLNMDSVISIILKYQNELLTDESVYSNFVQGSYWKKVVAASPNRTMIPYFIFNDDYGTGNSLSNHGQHKMSGTYVSFPSLPLEYRSKLEHIFLTLLFHSDDRSTFGNARVFSALIAEINSIGKKGIKIKSADFEGTVYPTFATVTGDNLGIHAICGFAQSFTCNYPCAVCRMSKEDVRKKSVEDPSLYRTPDNYKADCKENNVSTTGIKEVCVWNEADTFHVTENLSFDIMHDLLSKGVCSYDLCLILNHYINTLKLFDLKFLNNRIENFDYGPVDGRNKPLAISADELSSALKMTAAETIVFVKNLGLMIGDKIEEKDEFWELYLSLRRIFDIVFAPFLCKNSIEKLDKEVEIHNKLFLDLSGDCLKVKFHNMTHYKTWIKRFGPLLHMWVMRFEAKHQSFKAAANAIASRVNISFSLTMKHQLQLMSLFNGKFKISDLEVSPKAVWICLEDVEIFKELPLPESLRGGVLLTPWAKCHGSHYMQDIALIEMVEADVPVFVFVHTLVATEEDELFFICQNVKTVEFNHHFHAYEVEILESFCIVQQKSLRFHSPLSILTAPNGNSFISLRHKW